VCGDDVDGGHATNALPQMARANVNCRIIPGERSGSGAQDTGNVAADPKVSVTIVPAQAADGSLVAQVGARHHRYFRKSYKQKKKPCTVCGPGCRLFPPCPRSYRRPLPAHCRNSDLWNCLHVFEWTITGHTAKMKRIGVKDFYDGVEISYRLIKICRRRIDKSIQDEKNTARTAPPSARKYLAAVNLCFAGSDDFVGTGCCRNAGVRVGFRSVGPCNASG